MVKPDYCARAESQRRRLPHPTGAAETRRHRERRISDGCSPQEGLPEAAQQRIRDVMPNDFEMRLALPTAYFLLRMVDRGGSQQGYVGLAPGGAHVVVAEARRARRFGSTEAALFYAGSAGGPVASFEIEAHATR